MLLPRKFFDSFSLVVLCLAVFILNRQLWDISQIELGDEAYYMAQGTSWFKNGIETDWGPVYSVWYAFLQLFESDSIALYYLNMFLMSALPTILLYTALRLNKLPWFLALYAAAVYNFSEINFPQGVKVSVFIFVLWLILYHLYHVFLKGKYKPALLVLCLFCVVFSYIRPENMVILGLSLLTTLAYCLYSKKGIGGLAIVIALIVAVGFTIGTPFTSRGEIAFKQDFTYNYIITHPEQTRFASYNNWVDYELLSEMIFGRKVSGLGDALTTHADLIITNHFWLNFKNMMANLQLILYDFVKPFDKLLSWIGLPTLFNRIGTWITLLIVTCALVSPKTTLRNLATTIKNDPLPCFFALLMTISPTIGSVYSMGIKIRYLPNFYFIFPFAFVLLLFCLKLRTTPLTLKLPSWLTTKFPAAVFLAGTAAIMAFSWPQSTVTPASRNYIRAALKITQPIKDKKQLIIFDNKDQLATHIGGRAIGYASYQRGTGFPDFLEREKVSLIVMSPYVREYYNQDSSVVKFIQNPPSTFTRYRNPESGTIFLLKKGIL
jgi:hypothetical protein